MNSPYPDIRQNIREAGMLLGVEQEFELFDRGRPLDFHAVFPRAIGRGRSIPFRNCDSAAIVEAGYMLCCDGRDAEYATVPIDLRGSGALDLANEALRCRSHMLETLRKLGLSEVRGYSTHLSISVPAGRERELAEAAAARIGPALILLMEGPQSPGLLIRTRRGRLEIGSEYVDDPQRLAAAIVLLAGAVHACLYGQETWQQLPELKLKHWEEATIRPGVYLPRDAYGESIYDLGRAASLECAGGGTITAGEVLEACAGLAQRELAGLTFPEALRSLDRVLDQPELLPIEGKYDVARVESRRTSFAADQSRTLKMLARSGGTRLRPQFVDWEGAAFEWRNAGRRLIIGMPWSHLPVLFSAARTDKILSAIAGAQTVQPILSSLDQLGTPQAFQGIDPVSLGNQALSDKGQPGKGGSPKPPGQIVYVDRETFIPTSPPRRTTIPRGLIGLLIGILLVGTLIGVQLLAHGGLTGSNALPQQGVSPSPPSGLQGNVIQPQSGGTPACSLNLINPASADKIPESGPLNVQWSGAPGAASYALKVIPPASFSVPWLFPTDGNSKTIYMENFPAAGDYQFTVDALDGNGDVLCSTALKFKRAALVGPSGKRNDAGGAGPCKPGIAYVVCP